MLTAAGRQLIVIKPAIEEPIIKINFFFKERFIVEIAVANDNIKKLSIATAGIAIILIKVSFGVLIADHKLFKISINS